MPAIADRLRQYAVAMADPTRGAILTELDRAGELTATQLARRLGLTPNNVYHHMRILLELEVVDPPRSVPGPTYVEKFYRISPELRAALRLDPEWYDRAQETMTKEDQKTAIISQCLIMSHLLRRAAMDFEQTDADTIDRAVRQEGLIMLSMNRLSREELSARLMAIRQVLEDEDRAFAEDVSPRTDLMLLAGLPLFQDSDTSGTT